MYIEICGNSIRIGRVESDEIFLDDGERIFWAYGLMNRNHYCPVKAGKSVFEIVET